MWWLLVMVLFRFGRQDGLLCIRMNWSISGIDRRVYLCVSVCIFLYVYTCLCMCVSVHVYVLCLCILIIFNVLKCPHFHSIRIPSELWTYKKLSMCAWIGPTTNQILSGTVYLVDLVHMYVCIYLIDLVHMYVYMYLVDIVHMYICMYLVDIVHMYVCI